MPSEFRTIGYAVADAVATITLATRGGLNLFSPLMARELIEAIDRSDADDMVRAVIVTGAGDRAFCAGLDLADGAGAFDFQEEGGEAARDIGGRVTLRLFESLKPLIAAVNGDAVGFGATMQLPMDFRLASTTARYGFVFTRRGIVPEAASSWFLPRLVGIQTALDWCYTGRLIDAAEAQARGLVASLHAPDDLLPAARALAAQIAAHAAPVSIALTRQMMWQMLGAAHPMEAHRIDSRAVHARGRSCDADEGVRAFMEKRAPVFVDQVSCDMPNFYPWAPSPGFAD